MGILETIILGIVQGMAEFLPISSSGHLALGKKLFGLSEIGLEYDVLLHLGTLTAVFVVYWKDISRLIKDGFGIISDSIINVIYWVRNRISKDRPLTYRKIISNAYRKFAMLVIVSSIPTGIIGFAFERSFKSEFDNPSLLVVGICLLLTSVLLLLADKVQGGTRTPKTSTYTNAFIVGISQGVATLPGLSRSGTTITVGLLNDFDRKFAVKFSFIMSIPAIIGACLLHLKDLSGNNTDMNQLIIYIIGAVVAGFVGYICIKTMLVLVKNRKFKYFSYYCMVVGTISIIAFFT